MPFEPPDTNLSGPAPIPDARGPGQDATPQSNAWSFRDLALFLASAVLALLAANFFTLAAYAALQPLMGWRTPPEGLRENAFFLLTLQVIFYGLVMGYIYLLIAVNYREPFWPALRWRKPGGREVARFFFTGVALAIAVQLAPALLPEEETFPLERLFSSPEAAYAIGTFAILVAPFTEELIFRGVLFRFFERLAGLWFAVGGTAILFGALHVPEYWGAWNHAFLIFLVGLSFSLARGLTGSLASSVILHLGYNTSLILMLFFQTQAFQTLGGSVRP